MTPNILLYKNTDDSHDETKNVSEGKISDEEGWVKMNILIPWVKQ